MLGWPLTVITLLDPGFETMRSDWPSQMIVNETVKWMLRQRRKRSNAAFGFLPDRGAVNDVLL